ncbi:MAG TPA: hypothetical protein VMP67_10780 [Candidatus Limnocylindria bacterium]|nr:hypothetical protein [Candidatus Limnocylindria bacterium]
MNADWVTYRHPLGLSLSHPPGWRVQHAQDALQIVPDDADPNSELILASGAAAQVARIDDPAVIAYMDDSIGQVQPGLRRTTDPTPVKSEAGDGIMLSYSGKLGDGRPGAAVIYSVLIEGSAVSLTAIAIDEKMEQRKPILADMFATFEVGNEAAAAPGEEAQVHPNLVGTWKQSRARHNSDSLGGGTYDSSSTIYVLAADGTYAAKHRSFVDISLPGGAGGSSTSETDSAGSWSADGEFLAVRDEEGGVVFSGTYMVFRNGIEVLPSGGGPKVLLERIQ